ncbi:DUF3788 family protein [Clostridium sp. 19966]|uniref:DUF3788 family protein n=1 Tax=Clostridium sp. 19966 TaxID=2768166 RepID=UPI0028DF727C|nr:DUF3788 family protein [Clostridium sp. 19966]MDT8717117.1 DUF3788 family protein [Clostridium sp. 19966]
MYTSTIERFMDKTKVPSASEISNLLGIEAAGRINKLENFLTENYDLIRELKFPFGNNYGWGYKYSCKSKHLFYLFFEKGLFTITISIGKSELKELYKMLDTMLPKTKEMWKNRYPCGDGGWIHYRIENDDELLDMEKLIFIKKKPKPKCAS